MKLQVSTNRTPKRLQSHRNIGVVLTWISPKHRPTLVVAYWFGELRITLIKGENK